MADLEDSNFTAEDEEALKGILDGVEEVRTTRGHPLTPDDKRAIRIFLATLFGHEPEDESSGANG